MGTGESNKLTRSQLSGFIAPLEQHCIGIAAVIGSNLVEATWIFQVSISDNYFKCTDKCRDHFSL